LYSPPQEEGTAGKHEEVLKAKEATDIKGKYRVILQCSFSPEIEEES